MTFGKVLRTTSSQPVSLSWSIGIELSPFQTTLRTICVPVVALSRRFRYSILLHVWSSHHRNPATLSQGLDHLGRRFDTPLAPPLNAAWRLPAPALTRLDPDGREGTVDDSSLQRTSFLASDAEDVISVHDLGLATAASHLGDFRLHDCDNQELSESTIDLDKLHRQLHLQQPAGATFAKSIRRTIEESLQQSQMDLDEYLPIDAFEKIFTLEPVMLLVLETFPTSTEREFVEIIDHILETKRGRTRRRIFGILTFMNKAEYIDGFIQAGICDHDLPLRCSPDSKRICKIRGTDTSNKTLFQEWDRTEIDLFYIYQKMFYVPFFDFRNNSLCFYPLAADVRLPWQEFEHKTSGGNGVIHKLRIHPSHHNFSRESQVRVLSPALP